MSLQEPSTNDWIMGTGATNHANANEGILDSISHNKISHSILVGNGSRIPITKTGHSFCPLCTLHRPLHLHNILITPTVIKKPYLCS